MTVSAIYDIKAYIVNEKIMKNNIAHDNEQNIASDIEKIIIISLLFIFVSCRIHVKVQTGVAWIFRADADKDIYYGFFF